MAWFQALLLGLIQGLTEFLPVSSSAHLMILKELLGVESEGFLDFTVTVHFATVLSTIVVFWAEILKLLKGLFKFKYNDETDYVCKIVVSMIPVALVGFLFKDQVEALFGDTLMTVAVCLLVTAGLLYFSDVFTAKVKISNSSRNGISYFQALVVGLGQAAAVAPGLSRSGTTIATGLISGVKRENMAQFSFLMVLAPIVGEQLLDIVKAVSKGVELSVGVGSLAIGFCAAFISGLFACKVMVSLVRRAKLGWFSIYCLIVAILIFVLA